MSKGASLDIAVGSVQRSGEVGMPSREIITQMEIEVTKKCS